MAKTNFFSSVLVLITVAGALFIAQAARASEIDRLLDLLVKKHVVTEEAAAALRLEIKSEKEQSKGNPPSPPQAQALVEKPQPEAASTDYPVITSLPFKLSGFVQTWWSEDPGRPNTVEMRRVRLQLSGLFTENISYKLQMDAVRSPLLLDAQVDFNYSPFAKITVGQFKIPFSQENLASDRDLTPIERSLVGNNLVRQRDTGSNGATSAHNWRAASTAGTASRYSSMQWESSTATASIGLMRTIART